MNEICLCVAKAPLSGLPETFPSLKLVFTHLGSSVPFLFQRMGRGAHAPEVGKTYSFRKDFEKLYFGTVSFHEPALRCAVDTISIYRLLLGSDYPFAAGDLVEAKESIRCSKIREEEMSRIFYKNANTLFDMG